MAACHATAANGCGSEAHPRLGPLYDNGELLTFTPQSTDVELFTSRDQAAKVARSIGGVQPVEVAVTVINEGMR